MDTSIAVTKKKGPIFPKATGVPPRTQSELKKRIRSITYSDALVAVTWLNATKGSSAAKRVLAFREELEELAKMLDALHERLQARKPPGPGTDRKFIEREQKTAHLVADFVERHNNLNRMLARRYNFVPALDFHIGSATWIFNPVPKADRGPYVDINDGAVIARAYELSVIAALARLATKRELYMVRLCEHCGERWRVSERKVDRFCSSECREAFYKRSPEFKTRKARNQQRYRESNKKRNYQFS